MALVTLDVELTWENSMSSAAASAAAEPREISPLYEEYYNKRAELERLQSGLVMLFFTKKRDINVESVESVKTKLAIVDAFVFLCKKHRDMIERFEMAAAWDPAWG
eukprot:g40559.t1